MEPDKIALLLDQFKDDFYSIVEHIQLLTQKVDRLQDEVNSINNWRMKQLLKRKNK